MTCRGTGPDPTQGPHATGTYQCRGFGGQHVSCPHAKASRPAIAHLAHVPFTRRRALGRALVRALCLALYRALQALQVLQALQALQVLQELQELQALQVLQELEIYGLLGL